MKPDTAAISPEATRFVSTLVEINHEITSILDLDELLQKIADLTNRIVPFEIFAIFLVDDETQELYLRFALGHPADVVKNLRIKVGDGVTGTALLPRGSGTPAQPACQPDRHRNRERASIRERTEEPRTACASLRHQPRH